MFGEPKINTKIFKQRSIIQKQKDKKIKQKRSMMNNIEISKILYEIADLLDMQSVQFKPMAYRKAAAGIESMQEEIQDIYKKGGVKALQEIPGVGQHIAVKIETMLKTGRLPYYEKLKTDVPKGLMELVDVPGIGPKKAMYFYKKLKIKNIADLEKAVKQHKIKGITGFGEKSEKNIEHGIEIEKAGKERLLLGVALPIANEVKHRLCQLKEVQNIHLAGSLARMKETIGDIDILACSKQPEKVMNYFTTMPDVAKVLAKGSTKSSILLKNSVQIDLRIVSEEQYGSALQYFIGSKDHNIALRKIAIEKGFKLSEYGLFKNNKLIAGRTEQDIYKKLGMSWPEPELRENHGEIQAAIKHKLPKLITQKDVKGDLHIHTNSTTDAVNSIEEMAEKAKKLGYEYIAVSDHAKMPLLHGITESDFSKYIKRIEDAQKKVSGIKILKAMEVNITHDGAVDMPRKILEQLDLVNSGIHSHFNDSKKQNTERLLKTMSNEYVTTIAHPTCRLFGRRNAMDFDWNKVFDAAKNSNKILEISANSKRIDLNDINARAAKESGVKLAINTDAHAVEQLEFIQFGVGTARRAWCEKKDILNTMNYNELMQFLKK